MTRTMKACSARLIAEGRALGKVEGMAQITEARRKLAAAAAAKLKATAEELRIAAAELKIGELELKRIRSINRMLMSGTSRTKIIGYLDPDDDEAAEWLYGDK